jgi:peptidase E
MNLHLFSSPGWNDDIRYIVQASRQYLEGKDDPLVAYLPLASLYDVGQEYTERAFHGLAKVEAINTELMELPKMEAILRSAALVYIPGGNTFLLNHRLHVSQLMSFLRKKVAAGLPVVAFSAGTVLCGPNILTANDLNAVPTTYFKGLDVTPFNFFVHYPPDPVTRAFHDGWLHDYHAFHDNPVLILADGAYVQVDGRKTLLTRGEAWILRPGRDKQALEEGAEIEAQGQDS